MFKKPTESKRSGPAPEADNEASRPDPFRQKPVKEHKRSMLTPSMSVKGDISGDEDLLLDCTMEGTINLPKNEILIGPEGRVKANMTALKVSVEGRVTGDIKGSERVVIKYSGRVDGNIVAPRVVLEDGCQFKGSVEMNIDSESGATRDTPTRENKPATGSGPETGAGAKLNQLDSQTQTRDKASGASS